MHWNVTPISYDPDDRMPIITTHVDPQPPKTRLPHSETTGSFNKGGKGLPILAFISLAFTAVNRALEIYDLTLIIPVFYGIYITAGWLNSLIFNNSMDAYASWTLFLSFVSILILISVCCLLTRNTNLPWHNVMVELL